MGFLKNLAAKGLGTVIGDDLADALIPDDLGKKIAKKAAKKAGEAAVDAAVGAAVGASVNSLTNRKNNSLKTPPPPPGLPQMKQTLRVMVAVNGKQYGSYEEAGLMNMINNGSLTKDTYVFVEGDSAWRFAKDVAQVNRLFGASAVPAPPVPFAPAPPTSSQSQQPKSATGADGLSAKMNSLIDAAVADGEISDLERQVLIRNAQAEGVAMDEFVVILEARLFEQRKRLQAEQEALSNQKKQAEAAAGASRPQRPEKKNEVRKCPACGSVIMSTSAIKCNECGYEFNSGNQSTVESSFDDLMKRLNEEDRRHDQKGIVTKFFSGDMDGDNAKSMIIRGYTMPTDKKGLISFIGSCKTCADGAQFGDPVGKAWKAKYQEALNMFKVRFGDDPEAMALIEIYLPKKKKFGIL